MNNFSVLPFYASVAEQNHRLPYAYGAVYPLYCDDTRILPFQIIRPTRQNTITSVILFDKDGTQVRDLTSDMSFDIVALDDYDVIVYTAQFGYAQELPIGQYYISVSDGAQTWFSDIFTIVSDITPYVKLEWYDEENFVMDAGTIIYNNPRFINRLYLNTEIGKPDYQFEEEGEQRDGYFFPEKQLSEKTYRFTILAPEYLCDVMRFIRMADHIQITADGYTYNADTFLITPKWQTQGDLASVEVEFESNTVAKKLGDARVRRTIGDFNNDYNDDYDGGDTPVPPVPPAPIEEAPENDVNFYDYDGTRVASYTISEAKALTALPTPPTHNGLTFQEWNWTLQDIATYDRQYLDVGANYITTDGNTHIIASATSQDVAITIQGRYGTISVNWGDGNVDEHTYTSQTNFSYTHTYAQTGIKEIVVSFSPSSETLGRYFLSNRATATTSGWVGLIVLEIRFGSYLLWTNSEFIGRLSGVKLSLPTSIEISGQLVITYSFIDTVVFPRKSFAFSYAYPVFANHLIFPKSISNFGQNTYAFYQSAINRLVVPDYTDTTARHQNLLNGLPVSLLSLPSNMTFANTFAINSAFLTYIDIAQGWTPNQSMTLNSSTMWSADNMVRFFTKLGTTQTAITLTFGSTNLNKLTTEQKAIATDKGYTLA